MLATDMLPNQICSVLLECIIVVKNNQTTKAKTYARGLVTKMYLQ